MTERVRIGELLVETGLITQEQLAHVLELQKHDPRRLGELVVAENMVSEAKVTQIVSQQLSVPWVSLEYIDFSRQLLNLVSSEIAQKYTLVPIYVRRGKNRQETLYVAMEDPSDKRVLDEITAYSGLPVRSMIAPPSDIRNAIRAYYLGLPPESPVQPAAPLAPAVIASIPPEDITAEMESLPPAATEDEPDSKPLPTRDSQMPEPSRKSREQAEMITLTMLDGTQMRLPRLRKKGAEANQGEMTARDLVEALRAQAGGADVSQVFGEDVNWQRMFAALLSLLMQKHLIHDWEFVRELKR